MIEALLFSLTITGAAADCTIPERAHLVGVWNLYPKFTAQPTLREPHLNFDFSGFKGSDGCNGFWVEGTDLRRGRVERASGYISGITTMGCGFRRADGTFSPDFDREDPSHVATVKLRRDIVGLLSGFDARLCGDTLVTTSGDIELQWRRQPPAATSPKTDSDA